MVIVRWVERERLAAKQLPLPRFLSRIVIGPMIGWEESPCKGWKCIIVKQFYNHKTTLVRTQLMDGRRVGWNVIRQGAIFSCPPNYWSASELTHRCRECHYIEVAVSASTDRRESVIETTLSRIFRKMNRLLPTLISAGPSAMVGQLSLWTQSHTQRGSFG